ncbi:MAG: ATP-binding protein [Brevinematia bacterium]
MSDTNVFSINTSDILNRFNYWITTNSKFSANLSRSKEMVNFSGAIVFGIDLNTSSIVVDLVNSRQFSMVVISKDKIFFGERKHDVLITSNFDKVIFIEDFSLSEKFIKYVFEISNLDSQKLLEKLRDFTVDRKITVLCKRKFYSYHQVSFIPARVNNVESYLSLIFKNVVDFSEEDIWRAKVILYELFDNAIEHGSGFDENKMIKSEVMISNNGLNLTISDQGEGFDISNIDLSLDKDKTTGRGIMMVKMLSDVFCVKDKGKTTNVFISRSNSLYIPFFV